MTDRRYRLVLLGPPGSGKGTQAALLERVLGVPAISTGEMVRTAVERGSALGRRVEAIVGSGSLVDDETMAEIVRERLREGDASQGFILDGYPRTLPQVDALDEIATELGIDLERAVVIEVPQDELVRRMMARGRNDDTEEVIRHRLEIYAECTAPVVERYRQEGLLVTVDGHRSIDEVHRSILTVLGVGEGRAEEAHG